MESLHLLLAVSLLAVPSLPWPCRRRDPTASHSEFFSLSACMEEYNSIIYFYNQHVRELITTRDSNFLIPILSYSSKGLASPSLLVESPIDLLTMICLTSISRKARSGVMNSACTFSWNLLWLSPSFISSWEQLRRYAPVEREELAAVLFTGLPHCEHFAITSIVT